METLLKKCMILVSQVSTDIIREVSFKIDRERQLVAIKGLRGVGKMTMIRQSVKQKYGVSVGDCVMDSMYCTNHLAEIFHMMDKVHKYLNRS